MVEAVVAGGLVGLAVAGLAGGAALATRTLMLVRDTNNALTFASARLEALRTGPRRSGADLPVAHDGTTYRRRWQVDGGRGVPVALSVQVDWGTRHVELSTEVTP